MVTSTWRFGLPDGYQVLLNQRDWKFSPAPRPAIPAPAGLFTFRGTVADLNGDSFPDLLAADAHGKLHFLVNHGGAIPGRIDHASGNRHRGARLADTHMAGESRQARPARHDPQRPVARL